MVSHKNLFLFFSIYVKLCVYHEIIFCDFIYFFYFSNSAKVLVGDMIKKRKRKKSVEKTLRGHFVTPEQLIAETVQQAHQQTGMKNFPEAVRLYSIAIQSIQQSQLFHPISPRKERRNSSEEKEAIDIIHPKKEELPEQELEEGNTPPLYVLYGCRAQAYQGMQQFDLSLRDAEASIRSNPHHAIAYAQKGKALYSLKRHKEALKCFEEGLKMADPNNAGLRRLVEIITQELQGTSITSSSGVTPSESCEVEQEALERQMEDNYATDQRAERRTGEWETITCTGTELLRPRHAYASALCSSQHAWYIFGGYGEKGEHMGDFYFFYFPSRTWYKLPVELVIDFILFY